MESDMAIFAGVVFLMVSIPAFIIWAARKSLQQSIENLNGLAARLGLQAKESKRRFAATERWLEGAPHGRAMRVWSFTTGSGKSRQHWVAASVQPRRTGALTFRLEPQGFGTKVAQWFGAKEIEVGDARFDAAWFVRTNQPELLRAALVPEVREKLMAARQAGAQGDFVFEDGSVRYAERGFFSSSKAMANLEAVVPALFDLADIVEVLAPQASPRRD